MTVSFIGKVQVLYPHSLSKDAALIFAGDRVVVVVIVVFVLEGARFEPREVLNKCLYREAPPRGPTPYPCIYHFSRTRYPLEYLLLTNGAPFTYLVQNFASLLTAVNALSFK